MKFSDQKMMVKIDDEWIDVDEIRRLLKLNKDTKPIEITNNFGDTSIHCPYCKIKIVNVWRVGYNPNFCHFCGQSFNMEGIK